MDYELKLSGEHLQIIWNCLLEQPAKITFPVLEVVKAQTSEQEESRTVVKDPAP